MAAVDSASTIVALSSGTVPSGVAIIRASGGQVRDLLKGIAGGVPEPRVATFRALRFRDGSVLDRSLVLYFPGPASFTGEDCAEFLVHGGRAVVSALLGLLCSFDRVRPAEAGEFSRRALANGKLDLLAVESLADLIDADTEAERRFAIQNGTGRHKELYAAWRRAIIEARAEVEAHIDFADEDDVSSHGGSNFVVPMTSLRDRIVCHIESYNRAEMVRRGLDVVLLGAPNVGKSSLLNALARRDAAIVTDEPGTTRDLIEVVLDLRGNKVRITDTAGIRTPGGLVERLGIERSLERARSAQLVLQLESVDGRGAPVEVPDVVPFLRVGTKADLVSGEVDETQFDHVISALTGLGLPQLLDRLSDLAASEMPEPGDVIPWRERHVLLLRQAVAALNDAIDPQHQAPELQAEALRAASTALGRIAGDVDVEDLLDEIFGRFCIGK